jgi:CubicO group peptidase (beta-lactamase class C family)
VGDLDGGIRSETFTAAGRPISRDAFFFLASVTKPIVATAFMHLVEDGLLNLRDPLVKFIPEFANAPGKSDVTPWHLLTHTSGVRDYPIQDIRRKRPSAADMTQTAIDAPLAFAPGTRYAYCSTSFLLLTRLIEKLTAKSHVAFLRERVLDPLGMEATYDPRGSKRTIVAVQGAGVDSRLMRFIVLRYLAGIALPGGGLFGTLEDLLRFGAATLQPRRDTARWVPLSPELITGAHRGDAAGPAAERRSGRVRRRGTARSFRHRMGQAHADAAASGLAAGGLARWSERHAHLDRP